MTAPARRSHRRVIAAGATATLLAMLTHAALGGASHAAGLTVSSENVTIYVVGNPP